MRTIGTFQDIYKAAKDFYTIPEEKQHIPIDPVVRMDNDGIWYLESELTDASNCIFECNLQDFHNFYSDFYTMDYTPSNNEIAFFIKENGE